MEEKTKNKSAEDETTVNDSDSATDDDAQGSEDMSDDEMAMFNKIMGDIQNANDSDSDGESADSGSDSEQGEQSDEELDEDQQKAFENIMAQIESGVTPGVDEAGGEVTEDINEDDFAAELAKLAQEVDAASTEGGEGAEASGEEKGGAGDDDIVEEVAEQTSQPSSPESPISGQVSTTEKKTDQTASQQGDSGGDEIITETGSDGSPDEIEAILKEIATDGKPSVDVDVDVDDDEDEDEIPSSTTSKGGGGNDSVADAIRALEVSVANGDLQSDNTAKVASQPTSKKDSSASTSSKKKTASSKSKKTSPSKDETSGDNGGFSIRISRKTVAILASLVMMASLGVGGYYCWDRFFDKAADPSMANVEPAAQPASEVSVARQPEPSAPINDDVVDLQRVENKADEIDQLRGSLLAKKKEIEELREYYHTGIDAEIESLADALKGVNIEQLNMEKAIQQPNVGMAVKAIQRRDGYIKKLATPSKLLYLNSEELLYLSRKARMLSMMVGKTSDIDVDGFVEEADKVMATHRQDLARLNIDDVDVVNSNIDQIWQRIKTQLKKKVDKKGRIEGNASANEAIWTAICNGDFTQKHKLTELSPEAAECLASWKGSDLYLNQLTTLPPEVARQLAKWKGSWLGLNGLTDLSTEAATYLAKWGGKGMSLNGLTRLSPRLVAILSEWQGEEIELVNVKHMAHWENPNTRLFLSEEMDMKLKGVTLHP